MFVAIPIVISSIVGGSGYYYYNSNTEIKKLDLALQNEIKKGLVDDDKTIVKSNINIKAFNLKKSNIATSKYFLWAYIFNFINSGNFNLKRTNNEIEMINLLPKKKNICKNEIINKNYLWDTIFKNIKSGNYKLKKIINVQAKEESEYKKLVNKINQLEEENKNSYKTTFLITDTNELPDFKQLYLKEKLIKEFPNHFKLLTRANIINKTLDRLEKLLEEYNNLLIEKNNTIKEFNKSLKYPKIHEIEKIKYESKLNLLDPKFDVKNNRRAIKNKSNHNLNQPASKFIKLNKGKYSIN